MNIWTAIIWQHTKKLNKITLYSKYKNKPVEDVERRLVNWSDEWKEYDSKSTANQDWIEDFVWVWQQSEQIPLEDSPAHKECVEIEEQEYSSNVTDNGKQKRKNQKDDEKQNLNPGS